MDMNIVVYSQCAECEKQGQFLDPASCARCLSGYEPNESDDKDDEVSESFSSLDRIGRGNSPSSLFLSRGRGVHWSV